MIEGINCSNAKFVLSKQTNYYADSVEWCPFNMFTNFMVSGTYQLDEQSANDSQTRQGDVVLYKFSPAINKCTESSSLSIVDTIPTSGILDMKWCPEFSSSGFILGVACSDGKLLLLKMDGEGNDMHLTPMTVGNLGEEGKTILLSLDWASENQGSVKLIASDSTGTLNFLQLKNDGFCLLNSWKAHQHESWIAAIDYSQPSIVYSGGDDCVLKCWDTRDLSREVFVNKRHSMGVTTVSKSRNSQYLLATGSYDENVFLWDTRSMKSPQSEIALHGGIWRLKWYPHNSEYLLSASMHSGFHVLSVTNNTVELAVSYDKHESLAYGVDWYHGSLTSESERELCSLASQEKFKFKNLIASCSFYDKLLHIWGINF